MPTKSEWKVIGFAAVFAVLLMYVIVKANQATQDPTKNPGGMLGIKA